MCVCVCIFFFFFFRASLAACGSSQARGQVEAAAAGLHYSPGNTGSEPVTYAKGQGNARSLTHWMRPGIEPASSWILVQFLTCWATVGIPVTMIMIFIFLLLKTE